VVKGSSRDVRVAGLVAARSHPAPPVPGPPSPAYAAYTLGVLVVVYVFNFVDRQILGILAEHIKQDLGLTDAQLGFLYGTAFAVFFAVFGIPLGRLADVWNRCRLISVGLAFWSAMTALSGLARGFTHLALARIGVGIGEASANPAALSLLSDSFPRERRATVLALYAGGIYLGAGLGLGLGGLVVDRWDAAWAGQAAPLGLRGWQVAFLAAGLPGLALAAWVYTLREPVRGVTDGLVTAAEPHPFREFFRELRAVVPPFNVIHLRLAGASGRVLALNLTAAGGLAAAAFALTRLLGNPAQWASLAVGAYVAFSWSQSLGLRDPATFALIFRAPSFRWAVLGFAWLSFTGYAYGFWIAPLLLRVHGVDVARAGLVLGGIAAAGGWLGTTLGGLLGDRWRRRSPLGRLHVGMVNAIAPLPVAALLVSADRAELAYVFAFPVYVTTALWLGPGFSTVQDLVLPHMRATASAAALLVVTLVGLALGPYAVGRLSVALGDLRPALLLALVANLVALACFLRASRTLAEDETQKVARAAAAAASND
jgi:MFS family permease